MACDVALLQEKDLDNVFLPYAGPITQVKSTTSIFVAEVFGIKLYTQKTGADITTCDVLSPAWYCKTVSRADQAFFNLQKRIYKAYLIKRQSSYSRRGNTLRISWDKPGPSEEYVEIRLSPVWSSVLLLLLLVHTYIHTKIHTYLKNMYVYMNVMNS